MKRSTLIKTATAALALLAVTSVAKAEVPAPLFSESFNETRSGIELKNGAKLGDPGSGVSGQDTDKAYTAEVTQFEGTSAGPVALLRNPIAVQGLDEVTVTLWYKPGERQVGDVTLLDAASLVFIGDKPEQWTLRVGAKVEQGKLYWAYSGKDAPHGGWLRPNEWTFIAATWKRTANEAVFYQGTKALGVKAGRRHAFGMTPEAGLQERANRDKRPETIGNTANTKYDRAFNGSIDNVRVYSTALSEAELEKIRQADLKNEDPTP
jgi:hypothetical protein